jgi:hypothetical protein
MSDTVQKAEDERLQKALDFSKYRVTLYNQKENAKLKLKQALIYAKNGGTFEVSQTLISFVLTLIAFNQEQAILIDTNGNPIEIGNLPEFLEAIVDKYSEATNDYLIEYKKIQTSRKIAPMMEW